MGLKTDYEPGLATEKHAQAMTERGALSQRYEKASRALAACWRGRNGRKTADRVILVFDQETFRLSTNAVLHCGQLRRL